MTITGEWVKVLPGVADVLVARGFWLRKGKRWIHPRCDSRVLPHRLREHSNEANLILFGGRGRTLQGAGSS